jgi:hypothetical protein
LPVLTLHVPHRRDDQAIPYAHQVDATHGILFAIAPAIAPADDGAILPRLDILELESAAPVRGNALPQFQAGHAADMPRAVWRRHGILDHAILRHQRRQQAGIVGQEGVIEAPHDLRGHV